MAASCSVRRPGFSSLCSILHVWVSASHSWVRSFAHPIFPKPHYFFLCLRTYILCFVFLSVSDSDKIPMREELEQFMLKAMLCGPGGTAISPSQLPWLARLEASISGGNIQVVVTHNSLGDGLSESLRSLCESPNQQPLPTYVVIICTSKMSGNEFCVLVLGECTTRSRCLDRMCRIWNQ